jgi:hypothetical protein
MWSEMAISHREEVENHWVHVQRVPDLTQLQLLDLLIRKCQEYKDVSETSKFSWGPSSFPQVEVEGS